MDEVREKRLSSSQLWRRWLSEGEVERKLPPLLSDFFVLEDDAVGRQRIRKVGIIITTLFTSSKEIQ